MSKTYRPYDPDQQLLLPAALQEWLPDDHLAYFISDVVDQMDLSEITDRYEREGRGGPPYNPRMMVKVLLYGYCVGVASSRRIAQRLHEDIAFLHVQPDGFTKQLANGASLLLDDLPQVLCRLRWEGDGVRVPWLAGMVSLFACSSTIASYLFHEAFVPQRQGNVLTLHYRPAHQRRQDQGCPVAVQEIGARIGSVPTEAPNV